MCGKGRKVLAERLFVRVPCNIDLLEVLKVMQRDLRKLRRSDEEAIKERGLTLDFDEIARKGSISREEVAIAKWYGIYQSRQPGTHMARVVIPGGKFTSVQARALADAADKYSGGKISFTTRQSAQLHSLRLKDLPQLLRDLKQAGLTTFHGCGDVTRNVAACARASVCPYARLDVLPFAQATSKRLSACRELDNLPRKFKITYSGCPANCGQPHINCIGIVAIRARLSGDREEVGFRVFIGGGMGWKPFIGQLLYGFVPPERIVDLCRAIGLLFRDYGDRYIRMYARLKFVVDRLGIDRCRQLVEQYLDQDGIDRSQFRSQWVEDCGMPIDPRPVRENMDAVCLGSTGGMVVAAMIPKGEMSAQQLRRLAELSEKYADRFLYSTNRQNLELHGVLLGTVAEVKEGIAAAGLQSEGINGLPDVVSCVGTTYCPLAVTHTHTMFDLLQPVVNDPKYQPIARSVLVNITGCPNSCSPYRIADIGLRGLRIREQRGSTEGYQITIGGDVDRLGQVIGEFKLHDCVRVVQAVLDKFLSVGRVHQTLAAHVAEVGVQPYVEAVRALGIQYQMAPNTLELSVDTGKAAAAGDMHVLLRDVPCRAACPARTNVPEYIRLIAEGKFDEAHLINQEDNVLPGVLGRICSRPCEKRCRYQWTSILGPVRICHLKRSAADGKTGKSRPLPPYFGPSGKRVAVVGGGPAGLAAARELKRYGHEVTILEREPYLGGQVRFGVPAFRLPRDVLEEDIDAIIQSGIQVRLGAAVDARHLDELCRQYDAVVLAVGANKPRRLVLPELAETAVVEGLHFMKCFNEGKPLPVEAPVLVIGGGYTAVDCARAARRLLGPNALVAIMYRRGLAQMSATEEELHELESEGIAVHTLVSPVWAVCSNGRVRAVSFVRNVLESEYEGGKPRITPLEHSDFVVECNTLIAAIGQTQDTSVLPPGVRPQNPPLAKNGHPLLHQTSRENLFIAGDFAFGNASVIEAIADGKAAAEEVDCYLMGRRRRRRFVDIKPAGITGRLRDHDLVEPPPMPVLPLENRGLTDEVELGFTAEQADIHAWRCYWCNYKFEIDQDKCIHCDWCIKVSPRNCILRLGKLQRQEADGGATGDQRYYGPVNPDVLKFSYEEVPASEPQQATYIWIDSDQCIRCGNCINICPTGAISVRKCDCVAEEV